MPKTERKSDRFVLCSPLVAASPQIQHLLLSIGSCRIVVTLIPRTQRSSLSALMKTAPAGARFIVGKVRRPAIGRGDRDIELAMRGTEPGGPTLVPKVV